MASHLAASPPGLAPPPTVSWWRRILLHPALSRQVDLDPGVCVRLADEVVVPDLVVRAHADSADEPCGNTLVPEQHHSGRREEFAIARLLLEEEIGQRSGQPLQCVAIVGSQVFDGPVDPLARGRGVASEVSGESLDGLIPHLREGGIIESRLWRGHGSAARRVGDTVDRHVGAFRVDASQVVDPNPVCWETQHDRMGRDKQPPPVY